MSRWKFMRQLEELLSDISPNEREEALQYYNDYFNDAGMENEQEVIKALGWPESSGMDLAEMKIWASLRKVDLKIAI